MGTQSQAGLGISSGSAAYHLGYPGQVILLISVPSKAFFSSFLVHPDKKYFYLRLIFLENSFADQSGRVSLPIGPCSLAQLKSFTYIKVIPPLFVNQLKC